MRKSPSAEAVWGHKNGCQTPLEGGEHKWPALVWWTLHSPGQGSPCFFSLLPRLALCGCLPSCGVKSGNKQWEWDLINLFPSQAGVCVTLCVMELTFFTAAHIVLWFGYVAKPELITHQCLSSCWRMLAQPQSFLLFLLCPLESGKNLGGDTARTAAWTCCSRCGQSLQVSHRGIWSTSQGKCGG